jgi:lysozyme
VFTPLTQNQFDALSAFVFNIGPDAFGRSAVLRRLNEGRLTEAACGMELWRRAELDGEVIVVDALVRRRAAEKALFLTPQGGWIPVPSPLIAARLDADHFGQIPTQPPVALREAVDKSQIKLEREERLVTSPVPPANEDEGPVTLAAAAVAARLKALVPDEAPGAHAAPPPSTAPEPPPAVLAEGAKSASLAEVVGPEAPAAASLTALQAASAARRAGATRSKAQRKPVATGPLVLLALIGLASFAWALYWAFTGRPHSGGSGLSPLAVSWFVGIIGIGCFGSAAYLMLERLGAEGAPDRDGANGR